MTELDLDRLSSQLRGSIVGGSVHPFNTLNSTMDEAKSLAERGEPEGAVVIAEEQTAGRGRFQRAWLSHPGDDLLFSIVFRPEAARAQYINMATALSVCTTIANATALNTAIKWPNDVKLCGRKVAGILVESTVSGTEIEYTVVGVGLNVNSNPDSLPEIASTATSMFRAGGRRFDRTDILIELLQDLDRRYALIRAGHSMKSEWASRLETLGQNVIVRWKGSAEQGIATGVDEMGNLLLTKPDGTTKSVVAGEATFQA